MGPSKRQRPVPNPGPSNPPRRLGLFWLLPALAIAAAAYHFFDPQQYSFFDPQLLPVANDRSNSEAFFVADLPGKGKGLVAARDIRQGELLIKETPLFTVPKSISGSPSELISQLLRNVDPASRDAFYNLSYVHFPKGLDPNDHPEEVALAIFQTNAVAAGEAVGIFPRMARLNHGCSSAFNSVYTWRQSQEALFVYALRDIRQGQELLTTYTDTKRTRSERRKFLSQQYGFDCTCAVCSLGPAESKASDKRLTAISEHYRHFATWGSSSIGGVEAIATINKIWKLEDKEGYWSERGRLAADAAWIAASHSDASAARQWAELAIKWYTIELGVDSEPAIEVLETVAHPEQHPAWGLRELLTVPAPVV